MDANDVELAGQPGGNQPRGTADPGAPKGRNRFRWFHFLVLTGVSLVGVAVVFPFVLAVFGDKLAKLSIPLPVFIVVQSVQAAVMLGGVTAPGLILGGKVGLDLPLLDALEARQGALMVLRRILPVALLAGGVCFLTVLASQSVFKALLPNSTSPLPFHIAPWKGLLASLYGGVVEELLMQLFLMSLIA